jgi:hypothetical protein
LPPIAIKVVVALSIGWSAIAVADNAWVRVDGGSWELEPQVLRALRAELEPYAKGSARTQGRKLKTWGHYTFQYQGLDEKGTKYVYVNALCRKDPRWSLQSRMIRVFDGGTCFFNLKFDPQKQRYYDLVINGDA